MKKIISLALATAMVFAMGAVAFAAGSQEDLYGEMTVSGTGTVIASSYEGDSAMTEAYFYSEGDTAALLTTEVDGYTFETASVLGTLELTYSAGCQIAVDMGALGLSKGDTVVVAHIYKVDGLEYSEYFVCTVSSTGYIFFKPSGTGSPFTFIKVTEETDTTTTATGSSADIFTDAYGYWNADGEFVWYGYFENGVFIYTMDPATVNGTVADAASPKTGEGVAVAVAGIAMLFAGVAVCGLTRKEQL